MNFNLRLETAQVWKVRIIIWKAFSDTGSASLSVQSNSALTDRNMDAENSFKVHNADMYLLEIYFTKFSLRTYKVWVKKFEQKYKSCEKNKD